MKLAFRGHRISSIRLNETNTMAPTLLLYVYLHIKMKRSYSR